MPDMIMVDQQNRGHTIVRKQMADYFSQYVPVYLQLMVDQNSDIDSYKQPMPKKYDSEDPLENNHDNYPQVGAYFNGTTDYRGVDITPSGGVEFNAIFEVTIFVAVVTAQLGIDADGIPAMDNPTRNTTLRQRDDLLNAVISAIGNSPSLGTANTETPMMVDLESMRTATPEPMKLQGQTNPRWVASGLITINVTKWETTAIPFIGYNNETIVTFNKID